MKNCTWIFKLVSIFVLQAFLMTNFALANDLFSRSKNQKSLLSPKIVIGERLLKDLYSNFSSQNKNVFMRSGQGINNDVVSSSNINFLLKLLSRWAAQNKHIFNAKKGREIQKLCADLVKANFKKDMGWISEDEKKKISQKIDKLRKRLAGIVIAKWSKDMAKKTTADEKRLLENSLKTIDLTKGQIENLADKIILWELPAGLKNRWKKRKAMLEIDFIINTEDGLRIIFNKNKITKLEDKNSHGDLLYEVVRLCLLEEGLQPDDASIIAVEARMDFLQGNTVNVTDIIYAEKEKLNIVAKQKVKECLLLKDDNPSDSLEVRRQFKTDEPSIVKLATAWVEGVEGAYGENEYFLTFSFSGEEIFSLANRSEKQFDAQSYADLITQKFLEFFGKTHPFINAEQIILVKNLDKRLGEAYYRLEKFAIDEKMIDGNEQELIFALIHEALHMVFPGFNNKFLNEAVTELITEKITGQKSFSIYADRVKVLKKILQADKTGELEKGIIDSYKSGNLFVLRKKVIELYGNDNMFNVIMNLELFEFLGTVVTGYLLSPEIVNLLRYKTHLMKKHNMLKFKELQGKGRAKYLISMHLMILDDIIRTLVKEKIYYRNLPQQRFFTKDNLAAIIDKQRKRYSFIPWDELMGVEEIILNNNAENSEVDISFVKEVDCIPMRTVLPSEDLINASI